MCRFLLPLLLLLILPKPSNGQLHPFVPVGTEWWYEQDDWGPQPGGPLSNHVYIKAVGDTLINGIDTAVVVRAWKIQNTASGPDSTIFWNADRWYFATDSSKAYYWDGSQWRMWLDYTLNTGDTLYVEGLMPGYNFAPTQPICGKIIDILLSIQINSNTLPLIIFEDGWITGNCNEVYQVYYGYAPHLGPLYYFPMLDGLADPAFGGEIRCFSHPILGFQHISGPSPCDYLAPVLGEDEEGERPIITVHSLPHLLRFSNELTHSSIDAAIYSLNGAHLCSYEVHSGISEYEHYLPPSVYLCVFKEHGEVLSTSRFVVF